MPPSISVEPWSRRMADSSLARYDWAHSRWHYKDGLLFHAIEQLRLSTGEDRYRQSVQAYADNLVDAEGNIRTYAVTEYSLDQINAGRLLFGLFEGTGDERYRRALASLREQLRVQPRTHEGGFWHKQIYPWQMWLDGIYMASPFYVQYGLTFSERAALDDAVFQIVTIDRHTRDPQSGLHYHGWDESRQQPWADPVTGCSPHFWSRAEGWYLMALVDVLELLPAGQSGRAQVLEILQAAIGAVGRVQDEASGLWYQVLDQGGRAGNYLEASGSCMYVYAMLKGVRLGYLGERWVAAAARAYHGVLGRLIEVDAAGQVTLIGICGTAGLGGTPYRDGSYEYYVGERIVPNDLHGVGPFILASLEMERLK